jgi:hypothetical protein
MTNPRLLARLALPIFLLVASAASLTFRSPADAAGGQNAADDAVTRSGEPTVLTLHRRFGPADREGDGRYQYVPFEVPAGTTSLQIALAYDRAGGANVVDLGLFEPGPLDLGTPAFRGWSGGSRDTIEIGRHAATPGYRTGPIPAGTWHVALGLYKVSAEGAGVTLTIGLRSVDDPPHPDAPGEDASSGRGSSSGVNPAARGATSGQPAPALTERATQPPRWWSGDLHVHTEHSDGVLPVRELARRAADAGLDFLIVTDHNTTTHVRDRDGIDRPLLIAGEEVTTPGGHANVWGLPAGEWVDFRVQPGDPRLALLVERAHVLGALFSINHPFDTCDQCDWTHEIPARLDAIEIWNRDAGPQPEAIALWERLLDEGRRVTAVASSDWHRPPARIGHGSVRVRAGSLAERPLLEAIRSGAVILMRDPVSPPPQVEAVSGGRTAGIGETLQVAPGAGAQVLVRVAPFTSPGQAACPGACRVEFFWNGEQAHVSSIPATGEVAFAVPPGSGRVRVQITSAGRIVALANPIWIERE